jgi:hypothetical protein
MAAWVEVYTRCMDGEYFRGAYCPRDGHSNDTSIEVADLVDAMRADGVIPTLDAVVQAGFHGGLCCIQPSRVVVAADSPLDARSFRQKTKPMAATDTRRTAGCGSR